MAKGTTVTRPTMCWLQTLIRVENLQKIFFEYTNGGWIKGVRFLLTRADGESTYIINRKKMKKRLRDIKAILFPKNPGIKGSTSQMISDFGENHNGLAPLYWKEGAENLEPWFNKINGITDINSFPFMKL